LAIKAKIEVKGLKELQKKLRARAAAMQEILEFRLKTLGEEAVKHAKRNKGYENRTGNLENSISYILYKNGEVVSQHIGKTDGVDISGNPKSKGFTLVIAAGMSYGKYVEDKGYNVLYLTKHFVKAEMAKIWVQTLEDVIKGNL